MSDFIDQPQHRGGIGYYNKLPARTYTEDGSMWTVDNSKGIFAFTRLIPNIELVDEDGHVRCDGGTNNFGPMGFHEWDEALQVCNCGALTQPYALTGNHDLLFSSLEYLDVVMGNPECGGTIVYMESSDQGAELAVVKGRHSVTARTLQEVLRLLLEWEIAGELFDSTEPMVDVAKQMIIGLGMTEEIKTWIWDNVPPNKVQLFLEGNTNAQEPTEPPDITGTVVEPWLLDLIQRSAGIGFMPTGA